VLVILVMMIYIIKYRSFIIVKSASPLFCTLSLIGLAIMSFTYITYLTSPARGQWVCNIRVWLTTLSVVILLANLLVKANRINNIFNDMSFQVRAYSDGNLLKWVTGMLAIEFVFLIFFSGFRLSSPEIVEGEASDASTLVEVYQCSTSSKGYWIWLALQFVYLGVFIIWGAYIAFMTKDTPTAFNESNHILGALLEFVFLPLILVPLDFVETSPESLVLLRGLGQNFVAITLTIIIFGPKLYYIFAGRGNDDNLSDVSRASEVNKLDVEMLPASTSELSPTSSPTREPSIREAGGSTREARDSTREPRDSTRDSFRAYPSKASDNGSKVGSTAEQGDDLQDKEEVASNNGMA